MFLLVKEEFLDLDVVCIDIHHFVDMSLQSVLSYPLNNTTNPIKILQLKSHRTHSLSMIISTAHRFMGGQGQMA